MNDILRVAAVSLDIVFCNPAENLKNAGAVMEQLAGKVDLVVLPELFTTGFVQEREQLVGVAEDGEGPTLAALRGWAKSYNIAVAGSFLGAEAGRYYNRGFFVKPEGEVIFYDKRHLFSLSSERDVYTAGLKEVPVVEFKGWNIALMVCYDLRFPVWARNTGNRYDMMLVPANWPAVRGYAWSHLLIARAIENQAVYVGADRGGSDRFGDYDGLTMVYDAMGMPVGRALETDERVIVAEVSLEEVRRIRRRMPVIDSADPFELIL